MLFLRPSSALSVCGALYTPLSVTLPGSCLLILRKIVCILF